MTNLAWRPSLCLLLFTLGRSGAAAAQVVEPEVFRELEWRAIGPYRGGRTKAAAGVPGKPGLFYIGACNGGIWKTDDFGRTWTPIFDDQPTGSIGAIAIAPSNPDIIYAGSGEGLQRPDLSTGDGLYKSLDAGRTWQHLGLRDGQQIPQIIVDPGNPDRLFVAVLGHPYGPNPERGVFRSLDGGRTLEKVLYRDADTGAVDLAFDPKDPRKVYAVLWEARQGPWENAGFTGPGSGLHVSADGGTTWRKLSKGLPDFDSGGLGRIGIAIAPSNPQRMFATVEAKQGGGLYRSDDAGESWARATGNERVAERASDFAEVKIDPVNPDIVYTASVVVWKSLDGGKTFAALRGAPGGDDYHRIWIDPLVPATLLIASDQGAIITVNGGRTFSSWYNQPTAQMFHVSTDNAFPYRVCGGQQESGSACVASRGGDGAITFRDWRPVGLEEYGYAAPDPLDPEIVYGGKVSRYDRRTGQTQMVGPVPVRSAEDRTVRTQPLVFSPLDPHTLYFASNRVWKTTDGGQAWTPISGDLTRKTWLVPASVGKYRGSEPAKPSQRGVVYTVAPSPVDASTLWAGSDDGLIHVTHDGGKTWQDVTPPALVPWAKVSLVDAGHVDALTAYAAINTLRLDDLRPHLLRTHDGGKSWTEIVNGLPEGGIVNVVREDPLRRGLLFAGTEQAVFVSFDDGDHWRSLRLRMPATSIRDLVIKDDDLVVATHGRGFYILDDIAPLRELQPAMLAEAVHLFIPQQALRVQFSTNTDTPLPPDEPLAPNPPDGAIIDYHLNAGIGLGAGNGPVTLEILDARGQVVRRFSSLDPIEPVRDEGNVPRYWIRPAVQLSGAAGLHRFVWDLHYPAPPALEPLFPIAAVAGRTPREPRGPTVLPGQYQVRLTSGGETRTQPLTVKLDPRLKTPLAALGQQLALSLRVTAALEEEFNALQELRKLRAGLASAPKQSAKGRSLSELEGGKTERIPGAREAPPTLLSSSAKLTGLLEMIQGPDAAPTTSLTKATDSALAECTQLLTRWKQLQAAR